MDAAVSTPGAEPWSSVGAGPRGRIGVVVIHGFTGNPIATRPLGQHLAAQGYAVEVPLLPGHGTSHRELARTSYRDWYDAVDRVVDRCHVRCDAVVLIGHSMGGSIALDLAAHRSADIDAVVVLNPIVRPPPGLLPRLSALLPYLAPYLPRDLAGLPTDDIAVDGVEEGAYALVPARAARSLLLELDRIRTGLLDVVAPLLVVRSVEDHTVDPVNALEVLELAGSRDLRTLVCHHSYHVPQLDQDAALVAGTISDFLDDVVGST
ncbi:MAG: alpha/beta fold hydrolase [Nitriliruptoraceae bacterium]